MTDARRKAPKRRVSAPPGTVPVKVGYDMAHREVCDIHHEHGPIMVCPFPDCRNGLPAVAEWVEATIPGPSGPNVWRRLKWDTGDGTLTWSWDPSASGFLSIPRVFWSEAQRRGWTTARSAFEPVYHYTGLAGFLGLLSSQEVWLSDYAYLNDVAELAHGAAVAEEAYGEAAAARPVSRAMLKAQGAPDFSDHRICVASFSADADSLGQWRAYGPIAVGMELNHASFGYANTVQIRPVIYDRAIQHAMLRLFAHLNASAWERETRRERQRLRTLYSEGPDRLLDLVAFFKNAGFADEREIRMVHSENAAWVDGLGVAPAPERFRASNGLIVPYVTTRDLHRDHPDRLPLREVVIGPGPKAQSLVSGVQRVLSANGYDIPVRISGVSYRQ